MRASHFRTISVSAAILLGMFARAETEARAGQILYASTRSSLQPTIVKIDFPSGSITPVVNREFASTATSFLVVDQAGEIIYDEPDLGKLRLYNPVTHTDTVLATGLINADQMVLDPDGKSVLVHVGLYVGTYQGHIIRVNLSTHAITNLTPLLSNDTGGGLVYDSAGRLFVAYGSQFGGSSSIAQIDPSTGAILNHRDGLNQLTSLAYDRTTNTYWTGCSTGPFSQFDPVTLRTTLAPNISYSLNYNSVVSDGNGHLIIGSTSAEYILKYGIRTHSLTTDSMYYHSVPVPPGQHQSWAIDHLAIPSADLTVVPEPTTWVLAATAVMSSLIMVRRRKGTRHPR